MTGTEATRQFAVAQAYADTRKWQAALDTLRPLLAAQSTDYRVWAMAARCRLALEQLADAESCARHAAELAADNEWPVRLLSIVSRRQHHYVRARAFADRAVALAPNAWQTHLERAAVDLDAKVVGENTMRAIRAALDLGPNEVEPHVLMGRIQLHRRHPEGAEAAFRQALRLEPGNAVAQNNLAAVALGRRQLRKAGPLLMGSLRADPQLAIAARNLDMLFSLWAVAVCVVTSVAAIVVNFAAQHSVSVPAPLGSGTVVPGVTVPSLDLSGVPGASDLPAVVLPTITAPATPETGAYTVAVRGHSPALMIAVSLSVGGLLVCALLVRRTIGPLCWQLLRRACRTNRMVAARLALALGGVVAMAAAGAVGLPGALPICRVVLATTVIAGFALSGAPRRRSRRRLS